MPAYLVKNGINYPLRGREVRREIGDIVTDMPPKAAKTYLARGDIEPAPVADQVLAAAPPATDGAAQ